MNFRSIFYPIFMCLCSKVRTNFSVLSFTSLCFLKFLLILVYFPRYFLSLFMFHFHFVFCLICLCLSSSIILFTNYLYISVFLTFKAFFLFSVLFSVCMFQKHFCVLSAICHSAVSTLHNFNNPNLFVLLVSLFHSVSPFPLGLCVPISRCYSSLFHNRSIISDPYCRRGWTQHMFRRLRREGGEAGDASGGESGLGDKFALVLQVARRVQNQLGAVSNAAEKCKK